ncbi:MAG: HAD family phosphatase [Synechococcales bacterium]|nr:HAD family phosphatase [Synechococcales bacterium]
MNIDYQAVAFDLDGVLIDSHPLHVKTWEMALRQYNIIPDEAHLHTSTGQTSVGFAAQLKAQYGAQIPVSAEDLAREKRTLFARLSETELMPVVGAGELLNAIAPQVPIGLCTMATRERTEWILQKFGWTQLFNIILSVEQVQKPKPDPFIYNCLQAQLEISPKHILAFEDTPIGVEAVVESGIQAIGVTTTHSAEELLRKGAIATVPNLSLRECQPVLRTYLNSSRS